jgi:hypothetical protein
MVGKVTRKKQFVTRHERSDAPVAIDLSNFVARLESLKEWQELIDCLSLQATSQDQLKELTAKKKTIRTFLLDSSKSEDQRLYLLTNVLVVFLFPVYFPFHLSLEWIVGCLTEMKKQQQEFPVEKAIKEAAVKLWTTELLNSFSSLIDMKTLQRFVPSLSAMISLQRDFSWMELAVIGEINPHELTVNSIFDLQVRIMIYLLNYMRSDGETAALLLASENIQVSGLTTEILRNSAVLLKQELANKLTTTVNPEVARQSLNNNQNLFRIAFQLLTLSSANSKDLLTTSGQVVALLQCLEVLKTSTEQKIASEILFRNVKEFIQAIVSGDRFSDWKGSLELFSASSDSLGTEPISLIVKCAIIRGFITIAELGKENSLNFLLDDQLTNFLLSSSSQGESAQQLFALHTLECWSNELFSLFQQFNRSISNDSCNKFLQIAEQFLPVLKSGWSHPNRQVLHFLVLLVPIS